MGATLVGEPVAVASFCTSRHTTKRICSDWRRTVLARRDLAFLTDESIAAFWEKVEERSTEQDEIGREPCWKWLGPEAGGRGLYSFKPEGRRVTVYAHHVAYHLRIGEILEGQSLFRLCAPSTDLRSVHSAVVCVNPVHWELKGTPRENQADNGRRLLPTSHPQGKDFLFTQGDLRSIRVAADRTALGRDVADAMNHPLDPAEEYLVSLAEKIVAALPENPLHSYRIAIPDEPADVPTPVLTSVSNPSNHWEGGATAFKDLK